MSDESMERRLREFFAPLAPPAGMTQRILAGLRSAGRRETGAAITGARFDIEANERGLVCVQPAGRVNRRLPAIVRARDLRAAGVRRIEARGRREMAEYLAGRRTFFTVPVDLSALPPFQRDVLRETARIPFGETRTYAWIARKIGRPRAVRAVGTALGRNPVPVIVPCHRVLRTDGGFGGYAFGVPFKKDLLKLESSAPVLEGCTTTRIVCRVGCAALRRARPERRVTFASTAEARTMGYRPCRTCRPRAAA
jgi:O-6-methylguanine DNA methyltransferase